nr:retrotransposon-related protein [Tanacetum cinerariifolium]
MAQKGWAPWHHGGDTNFDDSSNSHRISYSNPIAVPSFTSVVLLPSATATTTFFPLPPYTTLNITQHHSSAFRYPCRNTPPSFKNHFALKFVKIHREDVAWNVYEEATVKSVDVMLSPLRGCEMVLGIQWLSTLGTIEWNFKEPVMKFVYEGKKMCLRGTRHFELQWMSGKKLHKKSLPFMGCVWPVATLNLMQTDESTMVNIRPYRYPPNQKDLIEAMVNELMETGVKNGFFWNPEAQIAFKKLEQAMTEALVLALPDFQAEFVIEIDASGYAIGSHSGVQATLKRIGAFSYWKGMRKTMNEIVRTYDVCQRNNVDLSVYPGLLQPLPTPTQVWHDISMDFVDSLPLSQGKSTILVIVDRLSKYVYFFAVTHLYTTKTITQLFLDNIYRLHGLPKTIVNDRDKVFISLFWQSLFKMLQVQLKMSTAYHPQTNGQTELVNKCLECYLRCMIEESPKDWTLWLPLAKYCIVELVERTLQAREKAISVLQFNLKKAQDRMKSQADKHRSDKEFTVLDWVYLKLQPYRKLTIKKMEATQALFQVLWSISSHCKDWEGGLQTIIAREC